MRAGGRGVLGVSDPPRPALTPFPRSKQALVFHCVGCGSHHLQRLGRATSHGSGYGPPEGFGGS